MLAHEPQIWAPLPVVPVVPPPNSGQLQSSGKLLEQPSEPHSLGATEQPSALSQNGVEGASKSLQKPLWQSAPLWLGSHAAQSCPRPVVPVVLVLLELVLVVPVLVPVPVVLELELVLELVLVLWLVVPVVPVVVLVVSTPVVPVVLVLELLVLVVRTPVVPVEVDVVAGGQVHVCVVVLQTVTGSHSCGNWLHGSDESQKPAPDPPG